MKPPSRASAVAPMGLSPPVATEFACYLMEVERVPLTDVTLIGMKEQMVRASVLLASETLKSPFTSKVSRLIFYRILRSQAGLVKRDVSLKPVITMPSFNREALMYKDTRNGQGLTNKWNQEYWFRAALIRERFGGVFVKLMKGGNIETFDIKVEGDAVLLEGDLKKAYQSEGGLLKALTAAVGPGLENGILVEVK